jgi:hypothetical protein
MGQVWVRMKYPDIEGVTLVPDDPISVENHVARGYVVVDKGTSEEFAFRDAAAEEAANQEAEKSKKATKKAANKEEGVTGG